VRARAGDWLLLLALTAMWGSAFLFTKLALTAFPPGQVVALRLLLATVVLVALALATGHGLPGRTRLWGYLLAVAVFGNALPFYLHSWGQQHVSSALAGILIAAMPLFTLVLAHRFVPGERITPARLTGVGVGFAGIVVLLGPQGLSAPDDPSELLAQLAVLGAAACYAVSAVVTRHRPRGDVVSASAGTLILASALMLPFAALEMPATGPTPEDGPGASLRAAAALAALGVFSTGAATLAYFRLIASAGPSFLALANYLIPLWAVGAGALFLGERLRPSDLAALVLVLAGIALTQLPRRPARHRSDGE
jgi:drug/metabolite transporter (DMT)-like permease